MEKINTQKNTYLDSILKDYSDKLLPDTKEVIKKLRESDWQSVPNISVTSDKTKSEATIIAESKEQFYIEQLEKLSKPKPMDDKEKPSADTADTDTETAKKPSADTADTDTDTDRKLVVLFLNYLGLTGIKEKDIPKLIGILLYENMSDDEISKILSGIVYLDKTNTKIRQIIPLFKQSSFKTALLTYLYEKHQLIKYDGLKLIGDSRIYKTTNGSTKSIKYANELISTKSIDKLSLDERADLYRDLDRDGYHIETVGTKSADIHTPIALNFQVKHATGVLVGNTSVNRIGYEDPIMEGWVYDTYDTTKILNNGPPSIIMDVECEGKFNFDMLPTRRYDMNEFLKDNYTKIEAFRTTPLAEQPIKVCFWILNVELLYLSTRYTNFDQKEYANAIYESTFNKKPFKGFDELTFHNGYTVRELMNDTTKYINSIGINNVLRRDKDSNWFSQKIAQVSELWSGSDTVLLNEYVPTSVFDKTIGVKNDDENKETKLYGYITSRNIEVDASGNPINITPYEQIKSN